MKKFIIKFCFPGLSVEEYEITVKSMVVQNGGNYYLIIDENDKDWYFPTQFTFLKEI